MVQLTTPFVLLLSLATAALTTPVKRTTDQIVSDINDISTKLSALHNAIDQFPQENGTLQEAVSVDTLARALDTSIKKGTADITANGAISSADAPAILDAIKKIEPLVETTLTAIENRKDSLAALKVGGIIQLVELDLKTLDTDSSAFANSLILNVPTTFVPSFTTIRDQIHKDYVTAIEIFAS